MDEALVYAYIHGFVLFSHLFEDGIIPFLDGYAVTFHGCVYIVMWSLDCLADEKISVMSCVTNSFFFSSAQERIAVN